MRLGFPHPDLFAQFAGRSSAHDARPPSLGGGRVHALAINSALPSGDHASSGPPERGASLSASTPTGIAPTPLDHRRQRAPDALGDLLTRAPLPARNTIRARSTSRTSELAAAHDPLELQLGPQRRSRSASPTQAYRTPIIADPDSDNFGQQPQHPFNNPRTSRMNH